MLSFKHIMITALQRYSERIFRREKVHRNKTTGKKRKLSTYLQFFSRFSVYKTTSCAHGRRRTKKCWCPIQRCGYHRLYQTSLFEFLRRYFPNGGSGTRTSCCVFWWIALSEKYQSFFWHRELPLERLRLKHQAIILITIKTYKVLNSSPTRIATNITNTILLNVEFRKYI